MTRPSGSRPEQLRQVKITREYTQHAEGAVLVEFGNTKVICTATVENSVPRLLRDKDQPNGLSVADLRLALLDDGRIDYRWVARQKTVKMQILQVLGELWLLGVMDGEQVEIPFHDLDSEIIEFPLRLEFKYFSINRGLLRLPANFEPEQIRIVLRYPWMEKAQLDKKFDWKIED